MFTDWFKIYKSYEDMICSPLFVASLYLLCLPCTICEECYRLSESSYSSCGDTDGTCYCCRRINHTSVDAPTSTPQILVSKIIADDHTCMCAYTNINTHNIVKIHIYTFISIFINFSNTWNVLICTFPSIFNKSSCASSISSHNNVA